MKSLQDIFKGFVSEASKTELQDNLKKSVKAKRGTKEALIEYLDSVALKINDKKSSKKGIELYIYRSGYNDGFYIFDWSTDEVWSVLGNFGKIKNTAYAKGKDELSNLQEIYDYKVFVEGIYEIDKKVRDFLVKLFF